MAYALFELSMSDTRLYRLMHSHLFPMMSKAWDAGRHIEAVAYATLRFGLICPECLGSVRSVKGFRQRHHSSELAKTLVRCGNNTMDIHS